MPKGRSALEECVHFYDKSPKKKKGLRKAVPESCTLSGFTGRWHLDRIPKALDIACRLRVSSQTQNDGHGDVVCGSPHRDHRSHDLHVPFEPFFLFFPDSDSD